MLRTPPDWSMMTPIILLSSEATCVSVGAVLIFEPGYRTVRNATESGFTGSLTSMRNVPTLLLRNGTQPGTDPSHGAGLVHSLTTLSVAFDGSTVSMKSRDCP